MQYQTERTERRNRQHAFWLAILLHFALASVLYLFNEGQQPQQSIRLENPPVMLPAAKPIPLP